MKKTMMKTLSQQITCHLLAAMLLLVATGCSNSLDDMPDFSNNEPLASNFSGNKISRDEAVEIASRILHKHATRSNTFDTPSFDFIINDKPLTRGAQVSDTLAYILNYPENGGFAIIASDKRVNPVLAYSETGSFSLDNEIAKANFIDNIEAYISSADTSETDDYSDNSMSSCVIVLPTIEMPVSIGQRSPWDKYVIKEHPGSPVGCVPVATVLTMINTKNRIQYHDKTFQLLSIRSALAKGPEGKTQTNSQVNTNGTNSFIYPGDTLDMRPVYPPNPGDINFPIYSYDIAVDKVAELLYLIGKDIDVTYGDAGSSAWDYRAFNLLESLGFNLPTRFNHIDIYEETRYDNMISYLEDKYILYVVGRVMNQEGDNHAWIVDGVNYCRKIDNPKIKFNVYLHCDWGWDGKGNGYYSGEVFNPDVYEFQPMTFTPIKIEI